MYSTRAVPRTRDSNFPNTGPGTSAFMMKTSSDCMRGMTAKAKTKIPMPPIRWVKERQKSCECSNSCGADKTEAPVVVKPEAASKNASTIEGMERLMTKGRLPKKDNASHVMPTTTRPSRMKKSGFLGLLKERAVPKSKAIAIGIKKGHTPAQPSR